MFPNELFPAQLFPPHVFSRNTDAGIVNDTLTFSQTVSPLVIYNVSLSNTLTFNQNLSFIYDVSLNDTLSFTQSIKFTYDVSLHDTLTFSQTTAELKKYVFSPHDTLTLTQNATELKKYERNLTDTLTFSQDASDAGIIHLFDTLTFIQILSEAKKYHLSLFDTLTFNQTVVELKKYYRILFDPLVLFSSTRGIKGVYKLSDTLIFTDGITDVTSHFNIHLNQTLSLTDYTLSQLGSYHYRLHDQLRLTDSVIWTYPPIFRESLTDKLILLDDANAHGNSFARVLNDILTFANGTYRRNVEGISINVPILIGTKVPGGILVSGGTDPTRRRSSGSYYDSNLNYNPNLPYVILQSVTTIVLPAPLFGDTQTNIGSVIINRAVDGTIYTVIKSTQRNRLKWKFDVKRQKSNEMQNFLRNNALDNINVTDFKGNVWFMRIVNNPVIFEAVSKDGSCALNNERHQFELELEGFLVSSQALPC